MIASPTIPALLRDAAALFGDQPALVSSIDGATSYHELDRQADHFARGLIADGMAPGEALAVWAPNQWEWVAAAVGAQRAGGILVPLNTRLRGGEVADIVRRARVTRIVAVDTFLGRSYPQMLHGEDMPGLKRVIVLRSHATEAAEIGWDAFLALGAGQDPALLASREEQVAGATLADIMFTSGTTGAPKGAVFDHRRSLKGGVAWARITGMTAEDRYCCFGPFSHNASYKAGWVTGLMSGCPVYWPESYEPETILSLIADNRITVMSAPPTVLQAMIDHPSRQDWDISSLRFLSTGATIVPIQLMRRLEAETKIAMLETGYGMTECCGSATQTLPGDPMERIAYTVGKAIPGTEIAIAGPDGALLPIGETGEVLIRDDKLLIEYLDSPEATAAALDADGWLHTGDVGTLDADGYLRITDRLKDMYIVGGFNVYPAEIEKQISVLPGLQQCAVVSVPDARLGEVGHAFIVRTPGSSLSEAEVIAWSKANLANYKIPRGITFVDALPLNATGKVLKYELKALLKR